MGLDNGINVIRTIETSKIKVLQEFEESWDDEHKYDFHVCYWRKCWGLRNDILYLIGKQWDQLTDEYKFKLTINDIDNIIKLLKSYNAKTWENSIWSWHEHKTHNKKHIKNLKKLKKLMKKHSIEVYFYDSY